MHSYWSLYECKQKYGMVGNRLLIAAIFLLARRDHLAVNLCLLAAAIDSAPRECGTFFDSLIGIDPELRSLAKASDFVARSLDQLVKQLTNSFNIVIYESHLHSLQLQGAKIASLLEADETGSSRVSESIALAAVWIAISALFIPESPPKNLSSQLETAVKAVCESSALSFKAVKTKHSILIEKLLDHARQLLPSTFSVRLSKSKMTALLLFNLAGLL
jgi:hypothetical protein